MKPEIHCLSRSFLLVLFLAITVFLFMNGCAGNMGNSMMPAGPITSFAFVANSGSSNISALAISSSGGLSAVTGSPFAAGSGAEFLAVDSVHKFW